MKYRITKSGSDSKIIFQNYINFKPNLYFEAVFNKTNSTILCSSREKMGEKHTLSLSSGQFKEMPQNVQRLIRNKAAQYYFISTRLQIMEKDILHELIYRSYEGKLFHAVIEDKKRNYREA